MNQKYHEFYRGEIYYADMSNIFTGTMASMRPVLILLTGQGLYDTPTVIVTEVQRTARKSTTPTQVVLESVCGLPGNMMFRLESTHPIDKRRLRRRAGRLTDRQMALIDTALRAELYMDDGDYLPMEVGAP